VFCLPYPDRPAEQAGILAGDLLISIEDRPVQGRSILAIGAMARGRQGSSVKLEIMSRAGKPVQIEVTRAAIKQDTVTRLNIGAIPVLKISAFSRDTKTKLENALSALNPDQRVIIDLRGNAGGDLSAAIDSALLFLPENKTIAAIKTRRDTDRYESGKDAINTAGPLFIWQDEGTASAAEVFTAALTRNQRAQSIGKKSFGKGTKQEIFKLSDGSALFLTTGFLQTPDEQSFDGEGLDPDYPIVSDTPQTDDFVAKVEELSGTAK
jgi:carboxyl-terminal processing protease